MLKCVGSSQEHGCQLKHGGGGGEKSVFPQGGNINRHSATLKGTSEHLSLCAREGLLVSEQTLIYANISCHT